MDLRRIETPASRGDAVTLRGGPMDGMVATPDAPCFRDDWASTWPDTWAAKHKPGRYVRDGREATWQEDAS